MHSTNNLDDGYMGSGKRLRCSIRKYGVENHKKEILEFFDTRELLVEAEIKAISEEMITDNNCMNLKGGGTGGFINEEHRKKFLLVGLQNLKINQSKRIENMKKTMSTDKIKNKISESLIKFYNENGNVGFFAGKQHTEESKQKISEASKGKGIGESNSQYGTCWITKDGSNKKIKKDDLDIYLNKGWVKGRK